MSVSRRLAVILWTRAARSRIDRTDGGPPGWAGDGATGVAIRTPPTKTTRPNAAREAFLDIWALLFERLTGLLPSPEPPVKTTKMGTFLFYLFI
jgi:hypothetical protein